MSASSWFELESFPWLESELEHDGHDTKAALELLSQFELLLANHIADRDRLRDELKGKD